jgi:hypothetical protein
MAIMAFQVGKIPDVDIGVTVEVAGVVAFVLTMMLRNANAKTNTQTQTQTRQKPHAHAAHTQTGMQYTPAVRDAGTLKPTASEKERETKLGELGALIAHSALLLHLNSMASCQQQ